MPLQIPPEVMEAAIYQSGRTTLHTAGVVKDIAAGIRIRYGGEIALFEVLPSIQGPTIAV